VGCLGLGGVGGGWGGGFCCLGGGGWFWGGVFGFFLFSMVLCMERSKMAWGGKHEKGNQNKGGRGQVANSLRRGILLWARGKKKGKKFCSEKWRIRCKKDAQGVRVVPKGRKGGVHAEASVKRCECLFFLPKNVVNIAKGDGSVKDVFLGPKNVGISQKRINGWGKKKKHNKGRI